MSDWRPSDGHPVDEAKARAMVKLLGRPSREFLGSCCLPLYWWATNQPDEPVLSNGTVTLIKTPSRVIGLTADHVIGGALEAFEGGHVVMQLANTSAHDLRARIRTAVRGAIPRTTASAAAPLGETAASALNWPVMAWGSF